MPTQSDFEQWASGLREKHPEMFDGGQDAKRRKTARAKWDPVFLRVFGVRPWEIGQYTISEYAALVADLERHGLGGL